MENCELERACCVLLFRGAENPKYAKASPIEKNNAPPRMVTPSAPFETRDTATACRNKSPKLTSRMATTKHQLRWRAFICTFLPRFDQGSQS